MAYRWINIFIGSLLFSTAINICLAAETKKQYILGSQDVLTVRVYDLRRNAGEAYPWAALNGDFVIGADGSISLPIIGPIDAAGGSTDDVAKRIGVALRKAVDLAETPVPSVQISRYRPFYVSGSVKQPGKYEFIPNLTVLQAVSVAQGLYRSSDVQSIQKDIVSTDGNIKSLMAARIILLARQARLEAEISGLTKIVVSDELKRFSDVARVNRALQAETNLFTLRRNSLQEQIDIIGKEIIVSRDEIASLDNKAGTLDRLIDLGSRDLDSINSLVSRGLAVTPRKLAAEQTQATYENQRLDLQVAKLRAQQSMARAERDIAELRSKFKNETQSTEIDNRREIQDNTEKLTTARGILSELELPILDGADDNQKYRVRYKITRYDGSKFLTWLATEDELVHPGDVVRAEIYMSPEQSSSGSSVDSIPHNGPGSSLSAGR